MSVYCIVATDPETHNEWVMPKTADTFVEINETIDEYEKSDPRFDYRIELVQPKVEHYAGTNLEEFRKGQDWKIFTALELFPPAQSAGLGRSTIPVSDCQECGAYVKITMHTLHAAWHNKIANL